MESTLGHGAVVYRNFKQSIETLTKQYNLVLVKAVAKRADWACVQDETQTESLRLTLQMDRRIDRYIDGFSTGKTNLIYTDACYRMT